MSNLLSTSQAAKQLGLTRQYVTELLRSGKLKGQMVGGRWLIARQDLEEYQQQHVSNAQTSE